MLFPGNYRELYIISKKNKSEVYLKIPRVHKIMVINEREEGIIAENILCFGGIERQTINVFDPTKGMWTFQPSTDSLNLERYSTTMHYLH